MFINSSIRTKSISLETPKYNEYKVKFGSEKQESNIDKFEKSSESANDGDPEILLTSKESFGQTVLRMLNYLQEMIPDPIIAGKVIGEAAKEWHNKSAKKENVQKQCNYVA